MSNDIVFETEDAVYWIDDERDLYQLIKKRWHYLRPATVREVLCAEDLPKSQKDHYLCFGLEIDDQPELN